MLLSDNIINTEMQKKYEGKEYVLINYDVDPDGVKTTRNSKIVSPAGIHMRLVKSHYSVFGEGHLLNGADLAIELMAHFRFLTPGQYTMIFPQYTRQYLINLCNHGKRRKLIKTGYLTDGTAYYYLTDAGLEYIRKLYPPEYNRMARIPSSAGDPPKGTRSVHEIGIRDVPYTCLATSYIPPFDWYTSIVLENGKNPYQSVYDTINADPRKEIINYKKKKGSLIADGIMLFDDERAWIIEQDRGTEDKKKIKDKIARYGDYLPEEGVEKLQLIFNVLVPRDPEQRHKPGQGIKASLKRIKEMMESEDLETMEECLEFLKELVKSEENSDRRHNNMLAIVKKYKSDKQDMSRGYAGLQNFFKSVLTGKEKAKDTRSLAKARKIREVVLEYLEKAYISDSLCNAVYKGMPLIITSDFNGCLWHVNAYMSGLLTSLEQLLKSKYPTGYKFVKKEYYRFQGQGITLRNLIFVMTPGEVVKACYIISEISNDVAAFHCLKCFFDSWKKKDYEMHFMILVSNYNDAVEFVGDKFIIQTFNSMEPLSSTPLYGKAVIRFCNYAEKGTAMFVVNKDGECVPAEDY